MRTPALDAPGSASSRQKRVVVALITLAAASVAPIYVFADRQLPVIPGVLLSYLGCMALIQFVVAILLFGHAAALGVRSFLLLAAASEFAMLMAPAWMLAAPGALSTGDFPILGNSSSSTYVWLSIVLAFTLASALFPIVQSRETGSSVRGVGWGTIAFTCLAMLAAAAAWSVVTLWGADRLPTLLSGVAPQYQPTPVLGAITVIMFALQVTALVLLVPGARAGSKFHLWLTLVVSVVGIASVMSTFTHQRFTVSWYLVLVYLLVSSTALLLMLVSNLTAVDRSRVQVMTALASEKQRADLANQQLQILAATDPLTNLGNRKRFFEAADQILEQHRSAGDGSLCLAVLDFDGFKGVNDQWGHPVGDAVLTEVGRRLANHLRPDDVLCRLGGDEFGILIPNAGDAAWANRRLESLAAALREPLGGPERAIILTCSIGFTLSPRDGDEADVLFREADLAMYEAKRAGRNNVRGFAEELSKAARYEARVRQGLAAALRHDQIVLHYQPIVDLRTRALWGFEALLRWMKDDGSLAPAKDFIHIAEESGQIHLLGMRVLHLLAADAVTLLAASGPDVRISVNMSIPELGDTQVREKLAGDGVRHVLHRMVVEVTESTALDHAAEATLQLLRDGGAFVAVDDFGSGYSNLSSIERIRPDLIKIDRAFVESSVDPRGRGAAVVRAAAGLATGVDAVVVAEGIETPAQQAVMAELGVTLGQGYGLADLRSPSARGFPMPLSEAVEVALASR